MGRVYLRTLSDCADKGAILAVKCGGCGRVVYLSPYDITQRAAATRGRFPSSAHLADIERLLVCRGGQGSVGCGAKRAGIRAVWEHEISGVPKGVPALVFLNADDRERKRLIRKARG